MATRMQQRRGTAAQWISTNAGAGPVLNCASVPDTVFEPRAIVLFVNVSEPASEATSASLTAVFN